MSLTPTKVGQIVAGVVLLFGTWFLGGFIGETLHPGSALVGFREPLSGKIGCSVAVLATAFIVRRYLLRSVGLNMVCIGVTELAVFIIIMSFSGMTEFAMTDIRFNAETLYSLTWNVVVAFLVGAGLGHLWDHAAANKSLHSTPR